MNTSLKFVSAPPLSENDAHESMTLICARAMNKLKKMITTNDAIPVASQSATPQQDCTTKHYLAKCIMYATYSKMNKLDKSQTDETITKKIKEATEQKLKTLKAIHPEINMEIVNNVTFPQWERMAKTACTHIQNLINVQNRYSKTDILYSKYLNIE